MLPKMQASHFVKKYSVQFVNASGRLSAPFYFHDNKPHECSQTWQVVRSEFDQMMLENAREHGVEAHEGVHVLEVLFDGNRAAGVRIQRCRRAHDAKSARRSSSTPAARPRCCRTASSCGVWDPVLNKGAIWTYWKGAYRDTGRDEGATMVIQTEQSERLVLVHPAARRHRERRRRGAVRLPVQSKVRNGHEQTYQEEVERCAAVKARISGAERVSRLLRDARLLVPLDRGRGRRLGARR